MYKQNKSSNLEKQILEQLKFVMDPELHVNIVDLGLIYGIKEKAGLVEITMTLTTPGCPLTPVFAILIKKKLKKIAGVKEVKINLTFDPPWDPSKIFPETRTALGL